MAFSLFGRRSGVQERELRSSVSLAKFEVEFPKMLAQFNIVPGARSTKSPRFNEIDAACRFMIANAVKESIARGKLSVEDLTAKTTFAVAMIEFMAVNGGLEMDDVRELQGTVPANEIPKAAGSILRNAAEFSKSVSNGILRYNALVKKGKSVAVFDKIDDALEQFLVQRDLAYLSILGDVKDQLK